FDAKDGNRATFRFRGQHFQTCITKAGTRHAAEVIARACWMRFEDGEDKDAVTAFRNRCYEAVSSHDAESAKRPRISRPNDNKEVMQLDMMRFRLGLPATSAVDACDTMASEELHSLLRRTSARKPF
ncbi:unnamed protein product, partial [Symbiodinium sp. CCMP2456]